MLQFYTIFKVPGVSEQIRRVIDISHKENFIAEKKFRNKVINIVAGKTIIIAVK